MPLIKLISFINQWPKYMINNKHLIDVKNTLKNTKKINLGQCICSSSYSFIGGVAQKRKKPAKLRHLILLSRVTYWALVEMLLGIDY